MLMGTNSYTKNKGKEDMEKAEWEVPADYSSPMLYGS